MFTAYLDSSGRPDFDDKKNFVLAAVITNGANWQVIDNALKRIKLGHFPSLPDMEVEIHAKDMPSRRGIFKNLKWEQIYAIFDDVFRYVSLSDSALTIVAVVIICKKKLPRNQDIETWAYRLMFERINRFVERQNELLHAAQCFHQYEIMILDSVGEKKDQKLRRKLYSLLKDGTFYSKLTCLNFLTTSLTYR